MNNYWIGLIMVFVGYILLNAAHDVGRKEESKIKRFSKDYFIQFALTVIGGILLAISGFFTNS